MSQEIEDPSRQGDSVELSPSVVSSHGQTLGLKPTNPYDYDPHGQPRYMHPAQIGCVLSHRLALSVAMTHGASEFIICEEDVILPDNFNSLFFQARTALPPLAEVMQLEYLSSPDNDWEPVNRYIKRVRYPFCSACIWWSRAGASKAIAALKPVDRPFDILLIQRIFPFLNHYVPAQPIASQRSRGETWTSTMGDAPREEGTLISQ